MLASSAATRNEKSLPAARRRALFTRFLRALQGAAPVPAPQREGPLWPGTLGGGRRGPARSPQGRGRRGAGAGHRAALPHLPRGQPRVPQPQPGQSLRPSPRPQKRGTAPARAPAAQKEKVPAFPLMKTPPPRAGGELPRSISCHGDHKSRKSKNTHL